MGDEGMGREGKGLVIRSLPLTSNMYWGNRHTLYTRQRQTVHIQ